MARRLSFDLTRNYRNGDVELNSPTTPDTPSPLLTKQHNNNKWRLKWPDFCCCSKDKNNNDPSKKEMDLSKEVTIQEHMYTFEKLCSELKTDLDNGVTDSEASYRYARDGPNAFTPPKQTPWFILLGREMSTAFAIIIWIASAISLICFFVSEPRNMQYYIITIALALVVIITGLYSYSQQASSAEIFKSFKSMVPQATVVIRGGKRIEVPADRLVIGDLVYCKAGDRIPADIRIVRCESMKVDNSSLTGESDPLSRSPEVGHQNPLEAKNLAFFSTNCVDGSGYGIVVAIGDNTVMGNIARLVTGIKQEKTPIGIEISRFTTIITVMACVDGLIFFCICMGFNLGAVNAVLLTIGIIVGNIPEGLLPALTVALTLTAKRMASKNCLVKYLEAVETLGSTSVICSDKTGTLTQNRMTVEHCYLGDQILRISHQRQELSDIVGSLDQCWSPYTRCARLCSRSEFIDDNPDVMKRAVSGDASETAILRFMESVTERPVADYRQTMPKVAEKPFSSTYKYQYSIHVNPDVDPELNNNYVIAMKGAPERIIKLCSTVVGPDGHTIPMSATHVLHFEEAYRELGSMGERVLAFCDRELTEFAKGHKFDLSDDTTMGFEIGDMRFLGLIALIDPPRTTVPGAVAKCRTAGIKVIMVTGDHPITAQAIAKQVGIFTESHRRSTRISRPGIDRSNRPNSASIVVPGDELSNISDQDLRHILADFKEIVFARTSPQQKLRIVENVQALGQIVAVTGDGVNDSPALKKANIGVAMGIAGSDVSKQAADMILLDDNFASIVTAVEEGRRIFDNMKKTIGYILAGSVTTLFPFLIFLIFGFPQAIGVITVLLIALGTDLMPAISLAYEKAENDIMSLKPRNPQRDRLVTQSLILRSYVQLGSIMSSAGFLGYFIQFWDNGWNPLSLWQQQTTWNQEDIVLIDSNGDSWDYDQRMQILQQSQTAYFICIVVCQWMDVICSKTRRVSIFRQGMGNWVLNFSICFETALCVFFIYTPRVNNVLTLVPPTPWVWLCGLPFFIYLMCYEELRKFLIRRYPDSWLGKELLI